MSRYSYHELRRRAVETGLREDLNALGQWFELYGTEFWNGECFDADDGLRLYRIEEAHFDENGEFDYADVIGYEFK